jgi:hypothetical protein
MSSVRKTQTLICVVLAAALLGSGAALAQDTHYWNNQYGPRAMLLGGSLIGSVSDMSATYYNPGAMGYIAEPELLLSANAYRANSLTIQDGAGEGFDLETSKFNPLPNMLAGAFRKTWLGKNKLAYSLLTRYRFKAEISGSRVAKTDILDNPGEESFAGGLVTNGDVREIWAGITWARGFGEKVGFGITQYLSIRSESSQYELFAQARTDSGFMALGYDIDSYSADFYSFLWKAGLGLNFWPVTVGLTLTTPNVQLSGSGSSVYNSTRMGLDVDEDGTLDNTFATDIQEGTVANYHSPLSIGAGVALHLSKTNIQLAAEWFDAVDTYAVLELHSSVSQGTGETITRTLQHKLKSVTNYAIGIDHKFGDKYAGYLSFNTDYSARDPESDVSITGFDIYHTSGGANINMRKTELMLGLSYAWGSEMIEQIINLNPDDDSTVLDSGQTVEVLYSQVTFLVGFSVKL